MPETTIVAMRKNNIRLIADLLTLILGQLSAQRASKLVSSIHYAAGRPVL